MLKRAYSTVIYAHRTCNKKGACTCAVRPVCEGVQGSGGGLFHTSCFVASKPSYLLQLYRGKMPKLTEVGHIHPPLRFAKKNKKIIVLKRERREREKREEREERERGEKEESERRERGE